MCVCRGRNHILPKPKTLLLIKLKHLSLSLFLTLVLRFAVRCRAVVILVYEKGAFWCHSYDLANSARQCPESDGGLNCGLSFL